MMIEVFTQVGLGQWFRHLTGGIEVVGAVLVLVPSTGLAAALLLGGTMVGAVFTHMAVIGGSPLPELVLGAACAFVVFRLWPIHGTPRLMGRDQPSRGV